MEEEREEEKEKDTYTTSKVLDRILGKIGFTREWIHRRECAGWITLAAKILI